jgi:PiT family inorganic phosphate transporter
MGAAVANTDGQGLVLPSAWSGEALACGLLAASSWTLLTWWIGLPCSASQALIGGLLGAATVASGPGAVQPAGVLKTLVGLFISPPIGLLAGVLLMRLTLWLAQSATPRANNLFKRLQVFTSLTLALTASANDAQKVMGVMTLILILTSQLPAFVVPIWVKLLAASAFSLGILSGGYRLIRTLGGRLLRVRPIHGFVAQLATTGVILLASQTGLPVSSTQVIGTAIVGVGSAERLSKVRWQVAGTLITAWFLTIPVTAVLAGLSVWLWRGWFV